MTQLASPSPRYALLVADHGRASRLASHLATQRKPHEHKDNSMRTDAAYVPDNGNKRVREHVTAKPDSPSTTYTELRRPPETGERLDQRRNHY